MLHLYSKDKIKLAGLIDYKNLSIEKELASGDKTLAFSYPKASKFYFDIEEECYIRTKEDEFIVKEKNVQNEYTEFKCTLNLEDLEGKPWERYESVEQPIDKALALALAGTGWIVGSCSLTKKRTVRSSNVSSLDIIGEIRKTYRCDLVFNTLTKTIDVHEHLGEDRGTYFIDSLNLKDLSIQGNSYDFFTRIIPIGKADLRINKINNGKEFVENYQYSNKVKACYWIDERYTIVENLKEDAEAKLNEISKPYRSYAAEIVNLAKLNDIYKDILDYKLGDTVYLVSKDNKFRDKQRIVKIIEHPDEHELDSLELSNTTLSFEDIQTQFQEAADTIDNITTDNGTIDGSTIDDIKTKQISDFEASVARITDLTVVNAKITNLEAHNVAITGQLTSVQAIIGTLESNVATIDKLTVTHTAQINSLEAKKASITQLEAVNATIQVLETNVGKIDTLLNGNLSSENIQAGGITSDKLNIANAFITNAMIDNLDVNKVNAGDISTNKFRIKSDDGGIEIVGTTQQFKDKNNKVRIQMGKDAQGNFNFIIRGEDGTTTLIDHTGIKSKAIADDLIVDNMIANDAVGEKQINYSSFTNGFNKDDNTNTLKATKIKLNNQNQSLEVVFNSLKTQADGTKSVTESNSTTIGIMQGKITTAINNTQIVKDGQTILLKDDYNRTVATVDSMNNTISSHSTQIDETTGKLNNVEVKTNELERNLSRFSSRLSSTETKINNVDEKISTTNSKVSVIEQNLSSITSRVSSVETTTANIDDKIVNLSTRMNYAEQKITDSSIIATVSSQFYSKGQSDSMYTNKTTFEQTSDKLELIASSSKLNILSNSNGFSNQDWWGISNANLELRTPVTNTEIRKGFGLANKSTIGIRLSQYVELKANTQYTFQVTCKEKQINAKGFRFTLQDKDTEAVIYSKEYTDTGFKTFTFTVPKDNKYLLGIWHNGATQYNGSLILLEDITLIEGTFKFKIGELASTEDNASITLKANQIVNKVSASQISSIIEQNPKSVEVAFNSITSNVQNTSGKFIIRNGAIELYNQQGLNCFSVEPSGWLKVWGLRVYGPQNPIQFTGDGDKGIEINANKGNANYIDFSDNSSDQDYICRIIRYGNTNILSAIGGLECKNSPTNPTARFELRSDVGGDAYIDFAHNANEDYQARLIHGNGQAYLKLEGVGLNVTGNNAKIKVDRISRSTNETTASLYIDNNLDLQGRTIYNATVGSDRNFKHDIQYIDSNYKNNCYEFVRDHLKTVTFRYNPNIDATTRQRVGLIAQDLYSSEIGRVIQTKNDFGFGYDDMSYMNVLATALKKVIEDNELLEKKIKELESKIV